MNVRRQVGQWICQGRLQTEAQLQDSRYGCAYEAAMAYSMRLCHLNEKQYRQYAFELKARLITAPSLQILQMMRLSPLLCRRPSQTWVRLPPSSDRAARASRFAAPALRIASSGAALILLMNGRGLVDYNGHQIDHQRHFIAADFHHRRIELHVLLALLHQHFG